MKTTAGSCTSVLVTWPPGTRCHVNSSDRLNPITTLEKEKRAMETAVLRKAAMRPRLSPGLGKRRPETAAVSHSSHSPCQRRAREINVHRGRRRSVNDVSVELSPMFPRVQTLSPPLRGEGTEICADMINRWTLTGKTAL